MNQQTKTLITMALMAAFGWTTAAGSAEPTRDLIAVAWSSVDSEVYYYNEATRTFGFVGYTGFGGLNSLARDGAGTLYAASRPHSSQGPGLLITIDPETGAGTQVVELNVDIRGLAFSPSGVLYGIVDNQNTPLLDRLVTIDLESGEVTEVGATRLAGIQSLAFSPSGDLYAWDSNRGTRSWGKGLVILDPATGAATDVNYLVSGTLPDPDMLKLNSIQSIAFDRDGRLLGGSARGAQINRNELWEIDPSTGVPTRLASTLELEGDIRGIEFLDITLDLGIDIKPGRSPNNVNPHSRGLIAVAILASESLDVSEIDLATLAFGPSGASIAQMNSHLQDVNFDGLLDLVTHYRSRDTGIVCGDESATLTGLTDDGQFFEGSDSIQTVACPADRLSVFDKLRDRAGLGLERKR